MTLPSFIEEVDEFPHLRIVKLKGQIDHHAVSEGQAILKRSQKDRAVLNKSVVLDLRKVTRVDTTAIASLIKLLAQLKQKNFKLAIMNAPDAMRDQLEILKLDKFVAVFDSTVGTMREILEWSEEWD